MHRARAGLIWVGLIAIILAALAVAATSPLLAWRQPIYIIAGLTGVIAMACLLVQPLLIAGLLPGFSPRGARRAHGWTGGILVAAVVIHVSGLWITSPPDVVDALLFTSPTPFSAWGVIAMWALFAAALFATFRRRLKPRTWRALHIAAVAIAALTSVVHALLIQGTMGPVTKTLLCLAVLAATAKLLSDRGRQALRRRRA